MSRAASVAARPSVGRVVDSAGMLRFAAAAAIGATLLLAPFDSLLWRLRGREWAFTELEVAWISALVASSAVLIRERRWPAVPRSVGLGSMALIGVGFASAVVAAPGDAASLNVAIRAAGMVLLFLAAADLVRTERTARSLVAGALLGAGVAAVIGLLGVARGTTEGLLGYGRDFTVAGALRATGPFDYPNTAAMAWEMALLTGLPLAHAGRGRGTRIAGGVAVIVVAAALVLTFSRGALLGVVAGIVVIAVAAWLAQRRRVALVAIGLGVVVVGGAFGAGALAGIPLARFGVESDADLYRATYSAPATIELAPGATTAIPVTLTNTGAARWNADGPSAFTLDYHWLDPESRAIVVLEGGRTPLPGPVQPGASITLDAAVTAPSPSGDAVIAWDLHRADVGWLSEDAGLAFATTVGVGGPARSVVSGPVQVWPELLPAPTRPQLWSAATEMIRAHPLLGVGPGKYRSLYGGYLGWTTADPRFHANDLYLELGATTGLLGLGAFLWLVLAAIRPQIRDLRGVRASLLQAGLLAATVALLVHGLVDFFLGFSPTATLFWVLLGIGLGMALAKRPAASAVTA